MSIHQEYAKYGVDNYYKFYGDTYQNHHYEQITKLLIKNIPLIINNKNTKILDLCCGDGLVTSVLTHLNYNNICGCDPYLDKKYSSSTNKYCYNYNFIDIINGKLDDEFNVVICSFAMHLCDKNNLFCLISQLQYNSNMEKLIIVTPHKNPDLNDICNISYQDYELTKKGSKVRFRLYDFTKN